MKGEEVYIRCGVFFLPWKLKGWGGGGEYIAGRRGGSFGVLGFHFFLAAWAWTT